MKKQRTYVAYRKVYSWLVKYVVLLFICALFGLCSMYIYFFYSQSSINWIPEERTQVLDKVKIPIFMEKKYVHLDLKGAPPKVSYYQFFFSLLSNIGATGVVIEYEDMFPYEGILKNISALNAYTRENVKFIGNLAKANGLEIIPLIQTFGHLEFVLKLEEFQGLREVPEFPQILCPSKNNSMKVVTEMLSQVIEAHPDSKFIHIGADETQYIGRCSECIKKMNTENISKEDLYLKHVRKVCDFIETKYPEISVLMWDDQLRYLTSEGMLNELSNLKTTPVVWQYDTDVFDKLGPSLWNQYAKFFPKVWIASSFKGAVGENEYIVNVGHYIQNHHSWINVLENYKYLINFEAVIITGWQRYDHFSVLCELLPVALPSLIMNMKILEAKEETPLRSPKEVAEILKCQQPYALMGLSFGTPRCSYPGSEILENVYHLHQLAEDFKHLEKNSVFKGWMSSFHMYYNISNPEYIFKVASQLDHLQNEINDIEKDMSAALLDVYDVFTANEWIYTYIKPLRKQISELVNTKDRLLAKNIWPRRPFNENYPKENQS